MNYLLENGYEIVVSEKDDITCTLFDLIYSTRLKTATSALNFENIFIPKPSFFANRKKYKKCFVIDFADTRSNHKITEQSILSVKNTINSVSSVGLFKFNIGEIKGIDQLDTSKKYYLFNNYINSGSFRKFFIDESKLIKKAIELKSSGYSIIYVGSKSDKEQDQKNYPFVDIDLRGIVSIEQLVALCYLPNIYGAITYDNFLMHLMGIFGKKAMVLFRGRFLKKNANHHFLYVNNTFFLNEKNIVYL
jgi:ADP-heptose:LPS heptosyltransferase